MPAPGRGTLSMVGLPGVVAAGERLRPCLPPTPAVRSHGLSEVLAEEIVLKAENLQATGSFKSRGALNWTLTASAAETSPGLITVSAGNHAQALAWAASRVGARVTVVMPEGSSPMKIAATRRYGGEVLVGGSIDEAVARTHRLRESHGYTLVHPYDNPRIIAGQGTVGLELLRQVPHLDRILVPIGGGGLISGIALTVKTLRPRVQVIGVEPRGAATMRNAWDRGSASARLERIDTLAVSLAPAVVGVHTYALARRYVDDVVTVSEDAIVEATRLTLTTARLYAEPGGAVPLAALLSGVVPPLPGGATALVVSGGNFDLDLLKRSI